MSDNPFKRPASRAGIRDPRNATFISSLKDIEQGRHRQKQLSAHTSILRLEDLEEVADLPADEPLGQAPAPAMVASKMVAFFGPKGGMGTTTLAINVAGTIARLARQAVIIDMDLQLGSVPVSLNVKPERSIAELVIEAVNSGSGPLESGLDRHASGLTMIAQGDRIEELSSVTTDRLPRFFDAVGQMFSHVIVDGLRDFSDHAVAVMDIAHMVVLVVTQDVPAVRAAARSLRLFRRLGYGPERLKIVVNRYHKKAPVTLEAIGNALGQAVHAVVRNDFPLVEEALNCGVMVHELKSGSGVARDLDALARNLAGLQESRGGGRSFLGRIFKRE